MASLDVKAWLPRIETLQASLKWSVSPQLIVKWLENFEPGDRVHAYYLLLFLEYVPFEEMQARFEDCLKLILTNHPDQQILILPYGKPGKSGPMVVYPITHTKSYLRNEERFIISFDFRQLKVPANCVLVLVDDFIGSGDTFISNYSTRGGSEIRKWAKRNQIKSIYLISAVMMMRAYDLLSKRYSELQILSGFRHKCFDKVNTVFSILGKLEKLRSVAFNHGKKLYKHPLGYKVGQSLVAFSHVTPNNTLPIFWSNDKGWVPIYPRRPFPRINKIKEMKRDVAYLLSLMERAGLSNYVTSEANKTGSRKDAFIQLILIRLKLENRDNVSICQILGITFFDLDSIEKEAQKLAYLDSTKNLTPLAKQLYIKLLQKRGPMFLRAKKIKPFLNNINYLPKRIKGTD